MMADGRLEIAYMDPITQIKRRRFFKKCQEADQYTNRIELANNGHLEPYKGQFVGHLMKLYLIAHPDSDVTKRRNSFLSFCQVFNNYHIDELTTDALRNWFDRLKEQNNYTNKTLHCIKTLINNFFKYLVSEKVILDNPLLPIKFKFSSKAKRPRVVLTEEEIKEALRLMKEQSPNEVYPLIYTLVHTGARKNEMRKLKWDAVDFETGFIELHATKNGTRRRIKMSKHLKEYLVTLQRDSEWVFLNRRGRLLSASQVDEQIEILQRKHSNQKRWRCHSLRHSFAHNFLKRGGPMYQLQAILGHKSIQMTIDLYGNFDISDVEHPSPYNF